MKHGVYGKSYVPSRSARIAVLAVATLPGLYTFPLFHLLEQFTARLEICDSFLLGADRIVAKGVGW